MSYLKISKRPLSIVSIPSFLSGVNGKYDESILPVSTSHECYNFDFSSGALRAGVGLKKAGFKADAIWTYRKNDDIATREYLMYSYMGEIYYVDDNGTVNKLSGVKLSGIPKAVNYRLYGEDVILICSPSDNMVVWNGTDDAYYVQDSPLITSMAMHYERLFVTTADDKNTLWFSDDLDPTNWNSDMTEGGFIQLVDERGQLLSVLSFLGYVYIFREKGISRLTAYADQSEFTVSHLFTVGGKIYPDTIVLCGDRVRFASSDGLFEFDGLSAKKILSNLGDTVTYDEYSAAAYYGGKYYLACKCNFQGSIGCEQGDYVNNAILIMDSNEYQIVRGYDVRSFGQTDDLYAINEEAYVLGENNLPKRWSIPFTDLGSGRLKRIRRLYIQSKGNVKLTFKMDNKEKVVELEGSDTTSRVAVNMTGRKFGLTIDSDLTDPLISKPQIAFGYTE